MICLSIFWRTEPAMTDTSDNLHEVSTRDYLPEDAPLLAALFRAAILDAGSTAYSAAQCAAWAARADDAQAWAQRLQENWVRVAVDDEGEIAGFGGICMPGHIDLLFTAPHAARQGVASLILEDLLALAAAMGAREVTVDASDIARPLLARHGFEQVESREQACGDAQLNCHRMRRRG